MQLSHMHSAVPHLLSSAGSQGYSRRWGTARGVTGHEIFSGRDSGVSLSELAEAIMPVSLVGLVACVWLLSTEAFCSLMISLKMICFVYGFSCFHLHIIYSFD